MSDKIDGSFLLNCFKKDNLVSQNTGELSGFGDSFKNILKSNKLKWVVIGVGVYVITTKLGLIGMLMGKGRR